MKFTLRDLFLVTVIVALAVGWWVDRSQLIWSEAQTAKSLRDRLDKADPGWQDRSIPTNHGITVKPQLPPAVGFAFGILIFGAAVLLIVLVWKRKVHPSVLEDHRRF